MSRSDDAITQATQDQTIVPLANLTSTVPTEALTEESRSDHDCVTHGTHFEFKLWIDPSVPADLNLRLVFAQLRHDELEYYPQDNFIDRQYFMTQEMREIVTTWLFSLQMPLGLERTTIHVAMNIFDNYLRER